MMCHDVKVTLNAHFSLKLSFMGTHDAHLSRCVVWAAALSHCEGAVWSCRVCWPLAPMSRLMDYRSAGVCHILEWALPATHTSGQRESLHEVGRFGMFSEGFYG